MSIIHFSGGDLGIYVYENNVYENAFCHVGHEQTGGIGCRDISAGKTHLVAILSSDANTGAEVLSGM